MKTKLLALALLLSVSLGAGAAPQSQIIAGSPFVADVPTGSTFTVLALSQSGGYLTPLNVTINGVTTLGIYPFAPREIAVAELPFTVAGPATVTLNPPTSAKVLITYDLEP